MERMKVACQNGHRHTALRSVYGTTRPCLKCGANVEIPRGKMETGRTALTDCDILRILGKQTPLPPPPVAPHPPKTGPCPRCSARISKSANVCQHCQCYVGVMPDFLKRLCFARPNAFSSA